MPVIGKPPLLLNAQGTLTNDDLMNYYAACMPKLGIYLLLVVVTQFGLNITYLIDKCKGNAAKNVGAAALFTFIPWVLIFGVMIAVIMIFPGFKMACPDARRLHWRLAIDLRGGGRIRLGRPDRIQRSLFR